MRTLVWYTIRQLSEPVTSQFFLNHLPDEFGIFETGRLWYVYKYIEWKYLFAFFGLESLLRVKPTIANTGGPYLNLQKNKHGRLTLWWPLQGKCKTKYELHSDCTATAIYQSPYIRQYASILHVDCMPGVEAVSGRNTCLIPSSSSFKIWIFNLMTTLLIFF